MLYEVITKKGQNIVAVLALGSRNVDFNSIVQPKEAFRAWPVPDQRVERGYQRRRAVAPRTGAGWIEKRRLPPSLDGRRRQAALFDT